MTILEDLWYGNVRPTERSIVRGSKLDNLMNLLCQNEDDLRPIRYSNKSVCKRQQVKEDKICFCRKCGEKLLDNSRFCRKCGLEISEVKEKTK